jgi:hypothetical protein
MDGIWPDRVRFGRSAGYRERKRGTSIAEDAGGKGLLVLLAHAAELRSWAKSAGRRLPDGLGEGVPRVSGECEHQAAAVGGVADEGGFR